MDRAAAVIPTQATDPDGALTGRAGLLTRARLDPYWLAGFFLAAYATLSVCRFRRLGTMSWDLGIFEQAIRGYAHLHAPITELKGPGFNALGDHFSPIDALIAPFYRVFPSPITLLVAQAVLFAVSVIPLTRVAAHFLGRGRGLAVGAAYGLSWGVQRAVDFDFHEIAFAMPLLAFSLEALLRKRWQAAMWWALPLVLVKEDMGVTVALIGLLVWLRARHSEPRVVPYAIALGIGGIVASALAIGVILPAFAGAGYDPFNHISGDASSGVIPLGTKLDTQLRTLLWILLPTSGLLALRSPLLLLAAPTMGWRFLSHYDQNWGINWHYSAVLMPIVFMALVDAINLTQRNGQPWLRSYASQLPAAVAAASIALSTTLPLAGLTHAATYQRGPRAEAAWRVFGRIPDGASVEATVGPISLLTNRCTVYWVGGAKGIVPDYIALDNASGWVPDPVGYAKQLHPGATYKETANEQGFVVLRRE